MAETFLSPVIESLIQLLKDEVKSLKGVHREVESLKRELEIIQSLLKDADAREDRGDRLSEAVKTWVKHLREEADRLEDVIDEYRWHVAQSTTDKRGFVGFFSKIGCRIKALRSRYPISSHIRDINESLRRIKDAGQGYGLSQSLGSQGSSSKTSYVEEHDTRLGSHFVVEDDEYVDVPSVQEELKRSLAKGGSMRTVVSLVGQGGIGKTTLVKKVYNEVKHNFICHAWITVSQSYDREKLLRNMMEQIGVESTASNYDMIEGLINPIRQHLQSKRYVVVFDDIWDTNFWEVVKCTLPNNDKGSKIIITTRNAIIADTCKETPYDFIQELGTWSPNMAWELFCKKTFRYEFESRCPEELEELSRKIVGKCQGLPLAIGTIAGLLSRKKKIQFEWQRVLDNLNFEFKTDPQLKRISKIISLSYHDLPYHLKSCLMYFSIYPEDFSTPSVVLYDLWIAEGFVKVKEDKSLVEEAEGYLTELVKRNLVSLEILDGVYTSCRVHDLMHEFILSKAKDLCFCQILGKKKLELGEDKHRRLSIQYESPLETIVNNIKLYSGVRSIFLFKFNDESFNMSSLAALFQNFKLLKVLNFRESPLDFLPEEVGNLYHLRYLDLAYTKIKVLPKSIGKLHNLQVLRLSYSPVHILPKSIGKLHNLRSLSVFCTSVQELPMEINNLRNLRYIHASCETKTDRLTYTGVAVAVKIQLGFGHLTNLEVLKEVDMHQDTVGFMKELENLSKLKELSVSNLTKESARAICAVIEKLNHLENLGLGTRDVDEILDVELISSSSLLVMHTLYLDGRLNKLPHWISEVSNLQDLTLNRSKLIDNPLKYLKDLPNLIFLRLLDESYEGEQLHFEEGGFPKLNELYLASLKGLRSVKIEKETLSLLKILIIESCPLLEEVPSSIQFLRNLKELVIEDMPEEFVVRMQQNGGPDYSKIQHIPVVKIIT